MTGLRSNPAVDLQTEAEANETGQAPPRLSRTDLVPSLNRTPRLASNKQQRAKEAEEDRVLISRSQAGDMAAFRCLVERYQRRAFSIALTLVRDDNDAQELVQEAFIRVFKSIHTFQGTSSFFTWLYRIITNLSIDHIRRPGFPATDIESGEGDFHESQDAVFPLWGRVEGDPFAVLRRHEIEASIQTALDTLPSYHRTVIILREVEGLSYEEMAQAMGVLKGTIMSRLFHARLKLQRALADCYRQQIGELPVRGGEHQEDEL
jgi:RNA polymerase sigma-70 factor (ECF subfamily)